jgi:putative v-type ATPase subunit I
MIQPMNKYAFLVFHKDYEAFLEKLRTLGVLHVKEQKNAREVDALRAILSERAHITETLRSLRPYTTEERASSPNLPQNEEAGRTLIAEIEGELHRLASLNETLTSLRAEADDVRPWGAFDVSALTRLEGAGYALSFFTIPLARFTEAFQSAHDVLPISEQSGKQYFVLLHHSADAPSLPDAEQVARPSRSIAELETLLESTEEERDHLIQSLTERAQHWLPELEAYDTFLENRFTFGSAHLQADRLMDERLLVLEGFVPASEAEQFEQSLEQAGYCYRQVEFDPEKERVPIQLKNNSFTKSFEFVTGLFSLPNYQEIDQTYLIAPFFMLFFGMCFGDAGYGLILFCVSTYFRLKSKDADTSLLALGQWLGGGAFVVGLLMGGIFGISLPWASDKDYIFSQDNLMMVSILIGIIQVLLGKTIGAYKKGRQLGWKHSLAGYAWVLLLIALGLIYGLPKAEIVLPPAVNYVLYGVAGLAVLVAFFYNSPGKNPFVNLGSGLWTTYETASGLLGDSLSYIRLFAIGLTGGILGSVFNQLALSCVPASGSGASVVSYVVGWIAALLILLFGHGINFGIAMIGAFVHPLRLTFVEYYKNSEFEGGGKPYTPFKKK